MELPHAYRIAARASSVLLLALSPAALPANDFNQINLTSNIPGLAANTDPNLINPWGVAFSPTSPFWISDQGSGRSTLYNGAGTPLSLVVAIPGGTPPVTGPTGQVFNSTPGFLVGTTPSHFIFDTLGGTIDAWASGTTASVAATVPGAVFTGLTLASAPASGGGTSNYLYAADATGQIRVFDSSFHQVSLPGAFVDPSPVSGYAPFNVQLVGSNLYVTYAKLTPMGTGLPGGYIDVFDTSGNFVRRFSSSGALYAPWGITLAPLTFGTYGGDLLVGNFGNGEINAFDPNTGSLIGTINGPDGKPIVNDYLWALEFRTGGAGVDPNALYFTAGIDNQLGGLFGEIAPTPEPSSLILGALGIASLAASRVRRLRTRRDNN